MLNRREALGTLGGLALGFLFRGRGGDLRPEPEHAEQEPSAITITTSPQRPFRAERLIIPPALASVFVIENITIGGVVQPLFTADVSPALVLDPAQPAQTIQFRVRYVGKKRGGERFYATLIGLTEDGRRAMLPIDSGRSIVA